MNAIKPTPGPWRIAANGVQIYADGDRAVCLVQQKIDKAVEDANARLIAAAPDLLEALEEIALHPGPNADEAAWWRVDRAREAIAKASGPPTSSREP